MINTLIDWVINVRNKGMYQKSMDNPFSFVGLSLSRKCYARCIFCPVHKQKFKKNFMETKVYNTVIKELADDGYMGDLNFGENGDALLHPKFRQFFKKANRETIARLILYSNMGNMGKSLSKFVLKHDLSELNLNIDGASPRTYEASKTGLNYEVVEKNLLQFIELRNELESDCVINISIIPPVRYHEMRSAFNLSLNYDVPAIKRYWSRYLSPEDTINESAYFYNWANPSKQARTTPCPMVDQLFHKLYVNVEGYVYPCCLDYKTHLVYGNVMDKGLKEIWGSQRRQLIMKKIVGMNWKRMPLCNMCNEQNDFVDSKLNQIKHRLWSWV